MNPSEMTDEQLTQAIAERVMGWTSEVRDVDINGLWRKARIWVFRNGDYTSYGWDPLTDMNHLWMVVDRTIELGFGTWLTKVSNSWSVSLQKNGGVWYRKHSITINRAVLEAALEAVGGSHD